MIYFYLLTSSEAPPLSWLYIVFWIHDLVDVGRSGPLGETPQAHWWAAETRLTVASRLDG